MCGIAGLIGWTGTENQISDIIKKFQSSLHHRGPDNKGHWVSKKEMISLVHTRLSILDLSKSGNQPMHSSCDRYTISFNGEIYNHLEIRTILNSYKKNIFWKSTSDTETLLESFSILGIDETLKIIRGMFAIAVYDKKNKEINLIRDRYGEKPLYLLKLKNQIFAFSSDIIAFSDIKEFSLSLDLQGLACFFQRGYIAAPLSIWKNVKKIMPGTKTTISLCKDRKYYLSKEEKYWSIKDNAIYGQKNLYQGTYEEGKKDLENLFFEILKGQSLSDVPLGIFLSGGIDSSLIATLLKKISPSNIRTFSIGFENEMYDESKYAEAVANHLKTEHITLHAKSADALRLVEEMPKVYSEPFADSSQIPTTLLSILAKKYVTVALCGDGGDELFSGYTRYIFANNSFKYFTMGPNLVRHTLSRIIKMFPPEVLNSFGKYLKVNRLGDRSYKASEIIVSQNLEDYYDKLISYWPNETIVSTKNTNKYEFSKELGNIENMMLADQLSYLPNDILVKGDRAAMSQSLETRSPFLDHHLSDFAWSTPLEWRIKNNKGKHILRDILYKHVPKKLIDRPKQGFGLPVNEWIRGPLKDWAINLVDKKNLPKDGFINGELARKILNEHLSHKRNWDYRLWPILMWQQWNIERGNIK